MSSRKSSRQSSISKRATLTTTTTKKSLMSGDGNDITTSDDKSRKSTTTSGRYSITNNVHKRSSKFKPYIAEELPPCQKHRTRTSLDFIVNAIDQPKVPSKYIPPYRRNFRYFGYPQNLNLDVNTPPRVKSWGSIQEIPLKTQPKRQTAFAPTTALQKHTEFDPHWMGRLLKSNLLLENPGLIPPADQAAVNLGDTNKLKLIHPDFIVGNCPSDLYFPITPKARKAFCKINRMVHDKLDKQMHAFSVQNPTIMKQVNLEHEIMKDEAERKTKQTEEEPRQKISTQRRTSHFGIPEFNSDEDFISHYESAKVTSPVIKTLCNAKEYPGMNRQLYERPKKSEFQRDDLAKEYNDRLIYGIARIPEFDLHMPEDLWLKLANTRHRQQRLEQDAQLKKKLHDPDFGKFRTFTQLELRDQVLTQVREDFMKKLKEDIDTPLPPELFRDNREDYQPRHDYERKGELPPQGPFHWKTEKEEDPTEEELEIIENFIKECKDHHSYTHHLPGLMYAPRHPFPKVELDWMETGTEMGELREARKTPSELHHMPAYLVSLGKEHFREKLKKAVSEGAKELVGPEMWELYKKTYGVREESKAAEQPSTVEMATEKKEPVKRRRLKRKKKQGSSIKPEHISEHNEEEEEEEEEENEDEEEEEEEEGDEEAEEEAEEGTSGLFIPPPEQEPEYRLSMDLLDEDEFPLPDVRFSLIEFPKDHFPEGLKDDLVHFQKDLERGEPVKADEEEPKNANSSSSSSTNSEGESVTTLQQKFSHDAVSHLKVMYQDAVRSKHKSLHLPIQKQGELEPPNLKDVFLQETFAEEIEELLHGKDTIPKFLQSFL